MQKLIKFFYLGLLLGFIISLPAASGFSSREERWALCTQALYAGNVDGFKAHFIKDLLNIHVPVCFSNTLPTVRPFGLAHIAAAIKMPASAKIIEYLIQQGFDPNVQKNFSNFREIRAYSVGTSQVLEGYTGTISTPLPLDLAVACGNIPCVQVLLQNGADPYMTSMDISASFVSFLLKRCVSKRLGESPLIHAHRYRALVLAGEIQMPATAAEYEQVAVLLELAQIQDDIASCSIQ